MISIDLLPLAFFALVIIGLLARSIKRVRPNQRMAVFRLGRFLGLRPPGLHMLIPFIDLARVVDLDKEVPGWKGLSPRELEARVTPQVLGKLQAGGPN